MGSPQSIFNYSARNGALSKFHFELVASSGLFTGTKLNLGTHFKYVGLKSKATIIFQKNVQIFLMR